MLKHRFGLVKKWAKDIEDSEGGLEKFSKVIEAGFFIAFFGILYLHRCGHLLTFSGL